MTSVPVPTPPSIEPETVLIPTLTSSIPNAYFIGPYGRRVSFASQQRRALNVAWALESASPPRVKADDRVAVIGAGLAGLTMTVALAARGIRVSLYEGKPGPLIKQRATNHRYLHPTINFWPEEALEPTTEFPFFDWAAGITEDVIKIINKEWAFIHPKLEKATYIQRVITNTTVTKLTPQSNGQVKVECAEKPNAGTVFDAVIVTTGFGDEVIEKYTNTTTYWKNDYLENDIRDSEYTDLLVSGTGDGGLVDTLRLLHTDFELGAFCIEIATDLTVARVAPDIADIEREARRVYEASHEAAMAAGRAPKAAAEEAAEAAACVYALRLSHFIASTLPDAVKRKLDHSIINRRERTLTLVGRLSQPFSVNAAPIHRVLIAHALAARALTYEQGTLTSRPDSVLPKGLMIDSALLGNLNVTPNYSIARHGSKLPINDLVTDPVERLDLQLRQETATAWLAPSLFPVGHFDFAEYPRQNTAALDFAGRRKDAARSYVWDTARGFLGLPRKTPARFKVTPAPEDANPDDPPYAPERIPKTLFGIPVDKAPRELFKPAVRRARA